MMIAARLAGGNLFFAFFVVEDFFGGGFFGGGFLGALGALGFFLRGFVVGGFFFLGGGGVFWIVSVGKN